MSITGNQLRDRIAYICNWARTHGWRYGDSHSIPPCQDGYISCDRMISRALYDLGFKDQKAGGWNVRELATYLPRYGFKSSRNINDVRPNSIVIVGRGADQFYHAFFVVSRTGANCTKYDCGSDSRIRTAQPFVNVPIMEWSDRFFYACYWLEDDGSDSSDKQSSDRNNNYKFNPSTVRKGSHNNSVLLLQEILRARDIKGKDGKDIKLDKDCGDNTEYAINVYQERRRKMGVEVGTNGKNDGVCGQKMWKDLLAF